MVAAFFAEKPAVNCVHQSLMTHATGPRQLFLYKTRPRRPHEWARHPAHAHGPIFFFTGRQPSARYPFKLPGFGVQSRATAFRCHKQVSASGARGNEWAGKRAKLLLISGAGARRSSLRPAGSHQKSKSDTGGAHSVSAAEVHLCFC